MRRHNRRERGRHGQPRPAAASFQAPALRGYANACFDRGNALKAQGQLEAAVASYQEALRLDPGHAAACVNLGNALQALGRPGEAAASYRRALALHPGYTLAHFNLGVVLQGLGQEEEALACYQRASALDPAFAPAHVNLGGLLESRGRHHEATVSYQRALAVDPTLIVAHSNLGNTLEALGRHEEAAASYRRALALNPRNLAVHNALGNVLQTLGRDHEALACYQQALALDPHFAVAYTNRGNALQHLGRLEEALASHEQALALDPALAIAHANRGCVLHDLGRFDEALASYQQALALDPALALAHFNLALVHLLHGRFLQGWQEYEWRWRCPNLPLGVAPEALQPRWDGAPLADTLLVLHAEQGFGDTLQFARYVPVAASRCGALVLECPRELHRLLRRLEGVDHAVCRGDPLPGPAVHAPLMSLPLLLGMPAEALPASVPYLHADESLMAGWAERLRSCTGVRVGLVWSGGPVTRGNARRSLPLAALAPLAGVAGVSFVALQKDEAAAQIDRPPPGMGLLRLGPELWDFADTAAVVSQLDLVITVDTAVAHLAGALGRPVWILLPHVPDWRWLLEREDSPWYPTARLFRQPRPGDWEAVAARAAAALRELAAARHGGA